jgi:hypothetical protein
LSDRARINKQRAKFKQNVSNFSGKNEKITRLCFYEHGATLTRPLCACMRVRYCSRTIHNSENIFADEGKKFFHSAGGRALALAPRRLNREICISEVHDAHTSISRGCNNGEINLASLPPYLALGRNNVPAGDKFE